MPETNVTSSNPAYINNFLVESHIVHYGPDISPKIYRNVISSHEHRFLLSGLNVEKKQSWTERQAAYLSAV